ncbi:hypothetical protein MBM_00491 [Drepanopeziza brunnea f. sp. 'multigermtubi' MB_m1]|uniref:Uncharacterized protein n=1 Tax=Marssonina brunnea f. sp. multigermtubi (strain MB_m1) TaxID=1072389 RepID=K1XLB9_MARBU|nr:uncharacterized protein MBM_00491 [Drepanopeziza brunnea f. sp. 'multigermtubi' MB_m1]EKD21378.1 hypothetical protein MBM_00491 [Drepanopeziza brunnea f. sp. 'multigermtubi' MB_m1]
MELVGSTFAATSTSARRWIPTLFNQEQTTNNKQQRHATIKPSGRSVSIPKEDLLKPRYTMSGQKSKQEIIDERVSNLPLPEDPPVKSDWNSASESINAKSDGKQAELSNSEVSDTGLSGGPATLGSGVREEGCADLSKVGRQGKEGLDGLPKDATK